MRRPKPAELVSSRASRGFTLLEVLIALFVFGMIVVALTGGVQFAGRAWNTQESIIGRQDDLVSLQNVLRQLIASGRNFKGDGETLAFVSPMPRALARRGLYELHLTAEDGQFVLAWRPYRKSDFVPTSFTHTVLAQGVVALEVRYFAADGDGDGEWRDVWKDTAQSPGLVRVSLFLGANDRRRWPSFIVRPMIVAVADQG